MAKRFSYYDALNGATVGLFVCKVAALGTAITIPWWKVFTPMAFAMLLDMVTSLPAFQVWFKNTGLFRAIDFQVWRLGTRLDVLKVERRVRKEMKANYNNAKAKAAKVAK